MFRVKCPVCGGILSIDERLRKVVDHVVPGQPEQKPEEKLGSILHNIEKAKSEQEARLEAAKQREAQRKERLEEALQEGAGESQGRGRRGEAAGSGLGLKRNEFMQPRKHETSKELTAALRVPALSRSDI